MLLLIAINLLLAGLLPGAIGGANLLTAAVLTILWVRSLRTCT